MSSRHLSILKNILLEGNTHRIWQIINKSPMIELNAWIKSKMDKEVSDYRADFYSRLRLNQEEQNLVLSLQQKGFVEISSFLKGPAMESAKNHFDQLYSKAEELKKNQKVNTKNFWIRLTDEEQSGGLSSDNSFVKLALEEKVLRVITGYLKQAPYLHSVLLTHSLPTEGEFKNSQLWHQDNDNHRMVKMFVYFSDVENDEQGPFTFLPADYSQKVKNDFFKRHLQDSEISLTVDLKEIKKVKGKKMTAFICDTHRCYHMGSRVGKGQERLMLTSLYISLPSPYPKGEIREFKIRHPLTALQMAAVRVKEA